MTMFGARAFQEALRTAEIGRFLVYRPAVETTMTLAAREAEEGAPHGTVVLAEEQTAGRGRRGRSFYSPPGENLYFTLVLRLPSTQARALPLAVPLAVCRALRAAGLDARIKWPNDIWIADRKICGMLIDAEVDEGQALACAGIGINVNGDPTLNPELRETATSVRRVLGRPADREAILAGVCNELEATIRSGDAEVAAGYRTLSMILGRRVVVSPQGGETFHGTAFDIESDGTLCVRRDDGTVDQVVAADVSLRPS